MTTITKVLAREVLDSRGNPTVEAEVHVGTGAVGRAIAPSGASTGKHEAIELRDGDAERYTGRGVRRAVANVNERIAPELVGEPADDQQHVDRLLRELDGSENLVNLGANAVLAVSLAFAHAAAAAKGVWLFEHLQTPKASMPLPMVNMISGGLHAGRQIEFQDFLILPAGASSYSQALEWTIAVYRALGRLLEESGRESVLVADEGGYGPKLHHNAQALELLVAALEKSKLTPGVDVWLGLDVAATHFYRNGRYHLRLESGDAVDLDSDALIELLTRWVDAFPIISIEDGLAEDDWEGWKKLNAALGSKVQLVGDDLLVTNSGRLKRCIAENAANAVLVKPNQTGTLSEALDVVREAQQARYFTVVSARSGETEDATIADLAVAIGAGQIKIGSIARGERLAKYNQLLRIEERLGGTISFAGPKLFESLVNSRQ